MFSVEKERRKEKRGMIDRGREREKERERERERKGEFNII